MPKSFSTIHVLPLKVLWEQVVLSYHAKKENFEFIESSLTNDKVPNYNGLNTKNLSFLSQLETQKQSSIYPSFGSRENYSQSRIVWYGVYCWSTTVQSSTRYIMDKWNMIYKFCVKDWWYALDWVYRCPDEKQQFTFMGEKCFWWSGKDAYRENVSNEFQGSPLCNAWATLRLRWRNEKFSRPCSQHTGLITWLDLLCLSWCMYMLSMRVIFLSIFMHVTKWCHISLQQAIYTTRSTVYVTYERCTSYLELCWSSFLKANT